MEENVRINITGDNKDALKKLDKVEQAVNRLNAASNKVEIRVNNIKQTQDAVDRLYKSLQKLENATIQKLPQAFQTLVLFLKAANRGMAEFTARTAVAVSLVRDLGVIDFRPVIKQLSAAGDRIDDLIRKRRFLEGQVKSIDIRIDRGRIKKPEAIERARKEQDRLRESVRTLNNEIDIYNSKALTTYRKQSSALRALREEYDEVRKALVSLRIEQARVFAFDQKRLRQQGDIAGIPQRAALPSTSALTRPLERALRSLTEIIYITVDRVRRIFDGSRLLPSGRPQLPKAGELVTNNFNKALQDLTKIIYVTVGQIARIWANSRLLPPQFRLNPAATPALAAGAGQTGYPGAERLALPARAGALALRPSSFSSGGAFNPPPRNPASYSGGPAGPRSTGRRFDFNVPNNILGLEKFRASLQFLVKTAEIGSPEFQRYAKKVGELNNEIAGGYAKIAAAQSNPKTLKGKQLEAQALQEALEQAEIGSESFNELANKLRKVNAELEKTDKRVSGRGLRSRSRGRIAGDAASGAILGGGFPFLTGGASFSAAGGGVFGGIGGALFGATGGFAGGILGSAIGQSFDELIQAATAFGDALRKPTENLEALARSAGLAGSATSRSIALAEFLGAPELGASLAAAEVENVIGAEGVENLKQLSKESETLGNNFNKLGSRFQAAFAPVLEQLARFGNFVVGGGAVSDSRERIQQIDERIGVLQGRAERGGRAGKSARIELDRLQTERAGLEKTLDKTRDIETDISSIVEGRQKLLEDATRIETNRLSLRRDTLALEEGSLQVNRLQQEAAEVKLRLSEAEKNNQKNIADNLGIQLRSLEEQQAAAEAIRANNVRLAEIEIEREKRTLSEQILSAEHEQYKVKMQAAEITRSDADMYDYRLFSASAELKVQKALEISKVKSALLTVKEPEVRKGMIALLVEEILLLQAKEELQRRQIAQNEKLRQDARQALADQRDLADLQAKSAAAKTIRELDPSRALEAQAAGFGFFGGSTLLNENLIADRTTQIALFNEEIERLENRLKNVASVDLEKVLPILDDLEDVELLKQRYEKLQPAIDAARVNQERFNEALALISPVVSTFTSGLKEMVEGTKSLKEVFADVLTSIGDTLIAQGTRMIAMYIAMGIAKAFALGSSGSFEKAKPPAELFSKDFTAAFSIGAGLRATGGPVTGNMPYIVGEQGPELFVPGANGTILPNDETRRTLAQQNLNREGNLESSSVSLGDGGGTSTSSERELVRIREVQRTREQLNRQQDITRIREDREMDRELGSPRIRVNFDSQVINNVEYVTADQHRRGMAQAAEQGRALTLQALQNSVRSRRKVGLA